MKEIWEGFVQTNIDIKQLEYFFRIIFAGMCGSCIGFERRKRLKDAGLRTHTILAIGCALFMVVSKYCFMDTKLLGLNADAARIASNIVTGIGFLGAGVIFVKGNTVHGLTTAAGVWTTAAIGMVIGAGHYLIGLGTTILLLLIQLILHSFVPSFETIESVGLYFKVNKNDTMIEYIKEKLSQHQVLITSIEVTKDEKTMEIEYTLKMHKANSIQVIMEMFVNHPDVLEIKTDYFS